ncbi:arginine--tRNA ligase [Patescibacteria group bacterium]|nr:arginine--tRNA ligase [Patescibacteria group bacterium]
MATEGTLDIEGQIRQATDEALAELGARDVNFAVEWPADISHGDYAVNAAMAAAKVLGKNPRELAAELAPKIKEKLGTLVTAVEFAGPGFINITLAHRTISDEIQKVIQLRKDWGTNKTKEGKRIIIEFSNTNAFKEMHIGHLMSTIIGESLARIIESSGAKVARDSYGGDVGLHVAKALWGLQKAGITDPATAKEIGKAYTHGSRAYEESAEAKIEIDTLNVAIYKGDDRELMELWRKGRDVSMSAFKELHRLLDTHFDYYFFESETAPIGAEIVKDQLTRGVFEESEGAIIYKGEKVGLHTLVFITSRGTPTYEGKDVGLAYLKEERWPSDESIITTATEQIGHFKVFLAALSEIAPLLAAKTRHVTHGFLRLTSGKMSSREGNVITAASLIHDVIEKTSERNPDPLIAEQVAMAAIKYSILRQSAGSDIIFDFEKSLSLEGDSGPYLQYALVRARSVIAQATSSPKETSDDAPNEPYTLERFIVRYPGIVLRAQKDLAPHHLAQYLTQLASGWNSFYANERIIGGSHEEYKLQLARAFVTTMENGLHLLGIPVPEKM